MFDSYKQYKQQIPIFLLLKKDSTVHWLFLKIIR